MQHRTAMEHTRRRGVSLHQYNIGARDDLLPWDVFLSRLGITDLAETPRKTG